jgi:hypothetical protein
VLAAAVGVVVGVIGGGLVAESRMQREPDASSAQPASLALGSFPLDSIVIAASDVYERTARVRIRAEASAGVAEITSHIKQLLRGHNHATVFVTFSKQLTAEHRSEVLERVAASGVMVIETTEVP